jgi:hypothetical protein
MRNFFDAVFVVRLIWFDMPTCSAFVHDDELTVLERNIDHIHFSIAVGCAISRVDVDVYGNQTVRAVIAISITEDNCFTLSADKILDIALKFLCSGLVRLHA